MGKKSYIKVLIVLILGFVFTMGYYENKVFAKENEMVKEVSERQIDLGSYTIKSVYVENKVNLEVGDNQKFVVQLNETLDDAIDSEIRLGYKNDKGNISREKLVYNKSRNRYESNNSKISRSGNNKLMSIRIYKKGPYSSIDEIGDRESYPELFVKVDYYAKEYINPIKDINIVNKADVAINKKVTFQVEVSDDSQIDYIELGYQHYSYDNPDTITYKLIKKDKNLFEGTHNIETTKDDMNSIYLNYKISSVNIYKIEVI